MESTSEHDSKIPKFWAGADGDTHARRQVSRPRMGAGVLQKLRATPRADSVKPLRGAGAGLAVHLAQLRAPWEGVRTPTGCQPPPTAFPASVYYLGML